MCGTEHRIGSAEYRADHTCRHENIHGEIHGHLLEDERVSVSSLFRTDDTEHISYSCLYLPCSFAHLLALLYFPFLLNRVLAPAADLHHIHPSSEERKRETLFPKAYQGKLIFPSPKQARTFFEVLINAGFIKVLRGTYTW